MLPLGLPGWKIMYIDAEKFGNVMDFAGDYHLVVHVWKHNAKVNGSFCLGWLVLLKGHCASRRECDEIIGSPAYKDLFGSGQSEL